MRILRSFNLKVGFLVALMLLAGVGLFFSIATAQREEVQLPLAVLSGGSLLFVLGMLLRTVRQTNKQLVRFLEAIQYNDFGIRYPPSANGAAFPELAETFNMINQKFRDLRAEREADHQFLQAVIQQVDTGLLCVDERGKTAVWNNRAREIFSRSYLPNLDALRLIDPHLLDTIAAMRPGDRRLIVIQIRQHRLRLSIRMTQVSDREQTYRIFTFQNILTELEAQESQAWQKLIRILNHEIMNSMAPIVSLTETMADWLEHPPNDEVWQDLQAGLGAIRNRSQALMHFTHAYRQLSHPPEPKFRETNANALIARVSTLMAPTVRQKGIRWDVKFSEKELPLLADPELIEQVLINLLTNAIQAVADCPEPLIGLQSRHIDNRIQLIVLDNGKGISEDIIDQIFVPFFTTKSTGSGIGLAVCRQLVQLHGGTINVQSEAGSGSVFTIELEPSDVGIPMTLSEE